MGYVFHATDNPRRERCIPEMDTTLDDNGYWLETVDMAEAYDQEINQYQWDTIDHIASAAQYVRMRREINGLLDSARTPRQVYKVSENIPPDFFEMEDDLLTSGTWLDGTALYKGFYTLESKADSMLKRFQFVARKQSTTVRVFTSERPISPVLARKGGKILRILTAERLQACVSAGFTIYTQEIAI